MNAPATMTLGLYRPLDSFLHRQDTRAKLICVLLVLIFGLLSESVAFYSATLALILVSLLASGISLSTMSRNMIPAAWLVGMTFLYHLLFPMVREGLIVSVFGFDLYESALMTGLFYSLKLLLFVSVSYLLTLTSSPSDIADALARLIRPLRRIGVPVHQLSLILFMAIRFIPVLYDEFHAVRNAQIVRGVRFTGSLITRIRKTTAIIIPMFLAVMQRADRLALSITARGGGAIDERKRTLYSLSRFGPAEVGLVAAVTLWLCTLFVVFG